MRFLSLAFPILFVAHLLSGYNAPTQAPASHLASNQASSNQVPSNQAASSQVTLETVLKAMDTASTKVQTVQADFEWDLYEKVIDEVDDIQTGTIYFRRSGKDVEMKSDIKMSGTDRNKLKPEPKFVLVRQGKVQMYQPVPDKLTTYDIGKNRSDFESYLVLGFGGSGQDLVKAFDVTFQGAETIDGVATGKLQAIPKSERVRNNFARFLLWIDLQRGIAVQQQLFEPGGNYKLSKYFSIRINEKIPSDVFKLKTTDKTQVLPTNG